MDGGTPALPFLVVIRMTPFIARAPYNEVAAASFRIWNDSISPGLRPATDDPRRVVGAPVDSWSLEIFTMSSKITPSTTQRGLLSPVMDVAPRTRILGAAPNVPDTFCTDTPAACPSNIRLTSGIPARWASSALTVEAAPV